MSNNKLPKWFDKQYCVYSEGHMIQIWNGNKYRLNPVETTMYYSIITSDHIINQNYSANHDGTKDAILYIKKALKWFKKQNKNAYKTLCMKNYEYYFEKGGHRE